MKIIITLILIILNSHAHSENIVREHPLSSERKLWLSQQLKKDLELKQLTKHQYDEAVKWIHTHPCKNVDRSLSESQNRALADAIKKQLRLNKIEILQSFRADNWSIIYIENHISDNPYLFYSSDPTKAKKEVISWSGSATYFETSDIRKWLLKAAPGISDRLASCFAWHVSLNRD